MGSGYRSRSRILLDLLAALEQPCNVTTLLRAGNVNHARLKEYMAELQTKGWASETEGASSIWAITEKGRVVRKDLERFANEMADYGLAL